MQGLPTEVRTPWFGEAEDCQSPDPSLEVTVWGVLQPTRIHFMVVILLHSGKMLIYIINDCLCPHTHISSPRPLSSVFDM